MIHLNTYSVFLVTFYIIVINGGQGIHFQFPDSNPCEIIDIDATFHLRYEDASGHSEDAPLFTLDGATIYNESSSCIDPDLDHLLSVDLKPSGERLSLSFQENGTDVRLFVYFKMDPTKHFDNLNTTAVILADSTHLLVGDNQHSYRCFSEQIIQLSSQSPFYMNMTIRNVHLQAYNVNGSTYSPAIECSLDAVSTEEPASTVTMPQTSDYTAETVSHVTQPRTSEYTNPQTSMTSSSTTPPIQRLHFEVKTGNVTCIVLDGSFTFTIPFTRKDNTKAAAVVDVPSSAESYGSSCSAAGREMLQIVFFNDSGKVWSFDINIAQTGKSNKLGEFMTEKDVTYSWRNVSLKFYIDTHFKEAKDKSGEVHSASSDDLSGTFEASSSGSFKCNKIQNITVGNITLSVINLQYRAYGTTNKDTYPTDNIVDCEKPSKENNTGRTIGIIVGCVCGGVIIIAASVYLFIRQKKRKYSEL